jgi:hypothetical protein
VEGEPESGWAGVARSVSPYRLSDYFAGICTFKELYDFVFANCGSATPKKKVVGASATFSAHGQATAHLEDNCQKKAQDQLAGPFTAALQKEISEKLLKIEEAQMRACLPLLKIEEAQMRACLPLAIMPGREGKLTGMDDKTPSTSRPERQSTRPSDRGESAREPARVEYKSLGLSKDVTRPPRNSTT